MTDEEKEAADTAAAEAEAQAQAEKEQADAEFEESIAELTDEEKEAKRTERTKASHPDNQIDYAAELEKEKKARQDAEDALNETRRRAKERYDARHKKPTEDEEEEDDKPLTRRELNDILSENTQKTQKTVQEVQATTLAGTITGSEAERNLVLEIWKNRSFPSHLSLSDQIEEAYVIANRKKLLGERNEALRALKNKGNVNTDSSGTHREKPVTSTDPKLSPADAFALQQSGFVLNKTTGEYEKKLSGGRVLIRDKATKQVYVKGGPKPKAD